MKRTFKKILCTLLVVVMCLTAAPLQGLVDLDWNWLDLSVKASALTEGYYTYSVSDGKATITDVNTSISGDMVIPDTLGGYSVTAVGNFAFQNCVDLSNITIPDSIISIGDYAFSLCSSLTSITISNSVTHLSDYMFWGCTSLKCITIPESVTSIGDDVFRDCTSLTNIIVDEDNMVYSSESTGVLFNKDKTELVKYPAGNTRTTYAVPECVTSIGEDAFRDCINLSYITVAESNMYYSSENGVLFNKDKTILMKFPAKSESTTYIVPDSVETIYAYAFYQCKNLTSIVVPSSVTSIENNAFDYCTSLKHIYLDKNVKSFGANVFKSVSESAQIYYNGTHSEYLRVTLRFPKAGWGLKVVYTSGEGPSPKYNYWQVFAYGSYPQTRVSDNTLIAELNALNRWGDVEYDGQKYRRSGGSWYKFEPILWRVLSSSGYVISEKILDKQYFDDDSNDYRDSHIRDWLNNTFYNTAFNDEQKQNIFIVNRDHDRYSESSGLNYVNSSQETVFLPSASELGVNNYSVNTGLPTKVTDYSRTNYLTWLLRTAHGGGVAHVVNDFFSKSQNKLVTEYWGIRPALYLDLTKISCEHFYHISEITTPPTHLTEGVRIFTCVCGDTYTDSVAKLTEHTYVSETIKEATHLEEGEATYTCECGDTYNAVIAKVAEHSYEEVITAPTCTEQGYTTYTCECGDSYVDDYTDKLEHVYASEITTPATHLTEGVKTFTCECGDSYTEAIAKLKGHTYTSEVTKEATHLAEGETTYTCACGDSYTEAIAKLEGHTYKSVVTKPTCTAKGYTTYTCECGDSYIDDYTDKLEHVYASEITTPATHLTEGIKTYTCSGCGDEYTEKIAKNPQHTYTTSKVTKPTCTDKGYTSHYCECGDSYNDNYTSATGHKYNGQTCANCGKKCSCNCHKSGFMGFVWKIILFFNKLFKTNKTCACGLAHY